MSIRRQYWLATVECDKYGNAWTIRPEDGSHDSPEGVAQAAKLMSRIFRNDGPWAMVTVEDVPDIDVPIDDESADICREALEKRGVASDETGGMAS